MAFRSSARLLSNSHFQVRAGRALAIALVLVAGILFSGRQASGAPAYRASGTFTANTTAIQPPYPATMQADDVCLLVVESENQAISLTSAQGFVEVNNPTWSPQSAGTAATNPATRLAVYWKRTVGGDTAPTVADPGDHVTAQIHCFSGVITTGNPWDTGSAGNDGGVNDTTSSIPGATTTIADTLVVLITSTSFNGTSTAQCTFGANAALTGLTERTDNTNTVGLGGGHCMATGVKATAGAYGATAVTLANTSFKGAISLALKNKTTFEQSGYRFFDNADSTNVGSPLAALNTAASLAASGDTFRLRMLLHAAVANHASNGQSFKLQFAARSGTCDTAFTGEVYADVTAATAIAFNDNPTPADDSALTVNANDPTHGGDTVVSQNYQESNNFTNPTAINIGQDGEWDFSLIDNGATANTAYCFRVVTGAGAVIDTYTVIPEITTAQGTKFYFHDATTPDDGTLPGATTLSATSPNVTSATAGTNRDMDQTIGAAQASATLNTQAVTTLQRNWFRRFLSRPLAAQTLPTGIWNIQGGALESNAASNMLLWGAVIKVWRPSTGATVATLLDNPVLGTVEPGTTETNVLKATASITGVAVNDGDILIVELWAENTQGNATARVNTIFYDGTTEGSTTSNAAFLQAPKTISFYRSATQSAYRVFANADSTDVGTPLAALNTAAALGSGVTAFRIRTLLHVADIDLGASGQAYKLQFAGKGAGTCAAPSGTPATYTDVTGATVIAYNNNATPADGAALTANANDPTHGAHTVVNQTYEEANNFINTSAISAGQDGKWDFSLVANGAPLGTTYCFRVVKDTGTALDFYLAYPEVTTSTVPTPGSFNAVEVGTAVTGVIKTKVAGSSFNLDLVAVSGGVQQAGFTDSVTVELLGNTTLGVSTDAQNCPTSFVLQTSAITPTISGGRSTVSFAAVPEAWRDVRVRIRWPTGTPTVTWCSSDNFAIRPASFANVIVADDDWQTASATSSRALNSVTASGGNVHKAGRSIRISATAQNSAAATTTNYADKITPPTYSPAPVVINVTRVLPTVGDCAGCSAGAVSLGTLSTTSGVTTTATATYSEAGSISMQLQDQDWSSVDNSDGSSTAERYFSSAVFNVGRFVPDHFVMSTSSTPQFQTFGAADSACQTPTAGSKRSFTYAGQSFKYLSTAVPVARFTGQNAANGTLANYVGSLVHTSGISAVQTYTPNSATLTATVGSPTIAAIADPGPGGTVTINSGDSFAYVRSNTTPQAAFSANISLDINVTDTSENAASQGNITTTTAATFSSIAFDSGNLIRYGRLRVLGAAGSEEIPLPVPVQTEYWNGTGFVLNGDDHCTTLAQSNVAQGNYQKSLNACETVASTATVNFVGGAGRLTLTKPGAGNNGSVDLSPQLGASIVAGSKYCATAGGAEAPATPASKSYLQGAWGGATTYDQNPSARAAFGVYGAQPRNFIFRRENY